MECVRLKTFSKFGLQQIQVDTHYLQLYLWRFVADEKYGGTNKKYNSFINFFVAFVVWYISYWMRYLDQQYTDALNLF